MHLLDKENDREMMFQFFALFAFLGARWSFNQLVDMTYYDLTRWLDHTFGGMQVASSKPSNATTESHHLPINFYVTMNVGPPFFGRVLKITP